MKKYIAIVSIIIMLSITNISYTFAAGDDCSESSCKILGSTPKVLTDYISSIRQTANNVKKVTSGKKTTAQTKVNASLNKTLNSVVSWDSYFSSFHYYVTLPITQSVPYEVKRDQRLIQDTINVLTKTLEALTKKGHFETIVEDACKNVDAFECKLNGMEAGDIVGMLISDMSLVNDFFRKSIAGEAYIDQKNKAPISGKAFFSQMSVYYNGFTAENCSKCEGNFTQKAEKAIKNISSFTKDGNKGIQRWIDSWNLLTGKSQNYPKQEAEILQNGLSSQGVNGDNAKIIMQNLDDYNKEGFYSPENNFVSNTFSSTIGKIENQLDGFNESMRKGIEREGENVQIRELNKTYQDVQTSIAIESEIRLLYLQEIPFASMHDIEVEKLEGNILSLHFKLVDIIYNLTNVCKISEKVCNDQANGLGNCECETGY